MNSVTQSTDELKDILKKFNDITSINALDVATGDGIFIRTLIKNLKSYQSFTGVDINERGLGKAKRTFKKDNFSFLRMNAEKLTFHDNEFDLVSIAESVHHLPSPLLVLREIRRVLNKSGYFIIQESFSDDDQTRAQLSDVKIHEFISKNDILLQKYHKGFYSRRELLDLVEEAGFKNILSYISFLPLKCALCKYSKNCSNSKSKKMINTGMRSINSSLHSIKLIDQYDTLKDEANSIKAYIQEYGYTPASVIVIFAQK